MSIDFTVGAELEFYIFSGEGEVVADITTGKFPQKRFDILPQFATRISGFKNEMAALGFQLDGESGPGQFEVQTKPYINKLELALELVNFKEKSQEVAQNFGLLITFAAKPLDAYTGNGLHIHYSSSAFDPYGLFANNGSMQARRDEDNKYVLWAIGGMLKRMKTHMSVFFPNEQSRQRLVPYLNAPTKICWGRNNRSCAIRIPDGKPKRIEHRVAGADASPKMVIDAVIADAEYGIQGRIEPGEAVFGNAWDAQYIRDNIL